MLRSIPTRVLHGLLATAVVYQLASSLVMEGPRRGHEAAGLPGALFRLHETVGLVALGVVALYWIWSLLRRGETPLGLLLPWFSRERRSDLREDLARHARALRRRRLPDYDPRGALAGAVHGLGLLLVSAMGLTGGVFYVWHGVPGLLGYLAEAAKEVHTTLANGVWAYLIGHAGMALLHGLSGHDIIHPMFSPQSNGDASEAPPGGNPSGSV